mmetsp:Transcript_10643/g.17283  ORF Transcript_10643/g.17283 Transcript_10643/m.17283 type:complete len:181 (-) Transcript_10643:220-762(-)
MNRISNSGSPNVGGGGAKLSDDERQVLLKARRRIWIDGMIGMAAGSLLGGSAAFGYNRYLGRRGRRSTQLLTNLTLGGMALGGFAFSSTAARNSIPSSVAYINHRRKEDAKEQLALKETIKGRDFPPDFTQYQRTVARAIIDDSKQYRRSSLEQAKGRREGSGRHPERTSSSDVDYDMRD